MKFGSEHFGDKLKNIKNLKENVRFDITDNLPQEFPPATRIENLESPEEAAALVERLFPRETREAILAKLDEFQEGEYRARTLVGELEEATSHPHDFIISKDVEGSTLYFVDPEHQMGNHKRQENSPLIRMGDIRPKTVTLIGIRLKKQSDIPEMSMLRYRAAAISDAHLLKMATQREWAQDLLEQDKLPQALREHENEITFRFDVRPDHMLAQSRDTDPYQLRRFVRGEEHLDDVLEGKISSHAILMRRFLKLMDEGAFKRLTVREATAQAPESSESAEGVVEPHDAEPPVEFKKAA